MLLEKRSARLSVNVQLVGLADLEHSIATLASLIRFSRLLLPPTYSGEGAVPLSKVDSTL